MRIACLLVPNLPLDAELRAHPELRGEPLAISSGPGARAEILSVSREAALRGVRPGLTPPQARAVCPEIEVRVASPVLERTAREALLDAALSLSPRAELAERSAGPFASEGAVYVDASGIEALHGNERTFASILLARAERTGIEGRVAVAASRSLARLAARQLGFEAQSHSPTETILILASGRERDFLAPLSVDLLEPDDRTAQALTRFGIHRIRDLLRLSRRDLAARLGPELLALVARARGEENEAPLPEPRSTTLEEGQDLETPITNLEALGFVLRGLVSRLVERLVLRALGCRELRLTLGLEGGARLGRRIGVASPCQDERVLLRLLRLAIEEDPPPAAIERVGLLGEGSPLRREQLDLFLPRGPSPSRLDQTLAELASICGAERVGTPQVIDDHRPDAFGLKPFRAGPTRARPDATWRAAGRAPRLMIRALRPPLRAEVRLERGRPHHLRSALGQGEIVRAAGPWRTTGSWWSRTAHFAFDHYDVEMGDGLVLRVRYDWKTKRWQVDGLYD